MSNNPILLTGATGALGSVLLRLLANKGDYEVCCLVRASNRIEADDRIRAIVGDNPKIRAIRGDVTKPYCGISDIDREYLLQRVKCIVHCAASISFQDKALVHKTNVGGVHHVLGLADALNAWQVIHVSTAYVAGEAHHFSEKESSSTLRFRPRNVYEETKQVGEMMVQAWANMTDERRITILRPSILIGCADGSSPTFDAYYGYFKPIHRIAEALRERAQQGKKLPEDVRIENEWVEIPLVLQASPMATLNLIPIDWCGQTMVQLLGASPRRDAYHIVNPNPPLVRWVIDTSLRFLKIRGVRVVETAEQKSELTLKQSPLTAKLQKQVDIILDQYTPYTNHVIDFDMERAPKVLGDNFVPPPRLDVAYMERLLQYAISTNWGQKVPEMVPKRTSESEQKTEPA